MLNIFRKNLTTNNIQNLKENVIAAFEADDYDHGLELLSPLIKFQKKQKEAAQALIDIIEDFHLSTEDGLKIL